MTVLGPSYARTWAAPGRWGRTSPPRLRCCTPRSASPLERLVVGWCSRCLPGWEQALLQTSSAWVGWGDSGGAGHKAGGEEGPGDLG